MKYFPELVVFDLAGTTVSDNHDVHRVLQETLAWFGVMITQKEANRVMGLPKPVAIRQLLRVHNVQNTSDDRIQAIHSEFVRRMIQFYRNDPGVKEKPGVSTTLKALKKAGIKVAVDTGFDRQITNFILERMGWQERKLIDTSVTSDEVERGRPFPDLVFRAMSLTHVADVERVAKVGDTPSDVEEGKSAGCSWVIGITSGAYSREALELCQPTHLIDSIPELLPLLEIA